MLLPGEICNCWNLGLLKFGIWQGNTKIVSKLYHSYMTKQICLISQGGRISVIQADNQSFSVPWDGKWQYWFPFSALLQASQASTADRQGWEWKWREIQTENVAWTANFEIWLSQVRVSFLHPLPGETPCPRDHWLYRPLGSFDAAQGAVNRRSRAPWAASILPWGQ